MCPLIFVDVCVVRSFNTNYYHVVSNSTAVYLYDLVASTQYIWLFVVKKYTVWKCMFS